MLLLLVLFPLFLVHIEIITLFWTRLDRDKAHKSLLEDHNYQQKCHILFMFASDSKPHPETESQVTDSQLQAQSCQIAISYCSKFELTVTVIHCVHCITVQYWNPILQQSNGLWNEWGIYICSSIYYLANAKSLSQAVVASWFAVWRVNNPPSSL